MSSNASVVEHPKFVHFVILSLICSHFPALHASIGLDVVNLSRALLCCYRLSLSSPSCCTEMHDGMLLHLTIVISLDQSQQDGWDCIGFVFCLTMIWPTNDVTTTVKQFGIRSGWSLTGIRQWLNVSDLSLVTAQSVSQLAAQIWVCHTGLRGCRIQQAELRML